MSKFIWICLAIGLHCLLSGVSLSEAVAAQNSFRIKGLPASDYVEALGQLHRFLPKNLTQEKRCQRQALVLTTLYRGPTDQFEIAKIALAREEEIKKKFEQTNVDLLRNLYINASRQYLEKKHVDSSFIEVLGCLRAGYHNRDVKARLFLNDKDLNTVIKQFEDISSQPLRVLVTGDGNATGLDLHGFNESVKESIRNWVGHDEGKIQRLFGGQNTTNGSQPETDQSSDQGKPEGSAGTGRDEIKEPDQTKDYEQLHEQDTNPEALTSEEAETNENARAHLEAVYDSLIAIYDLLPEEASLGDRCNAYSGVMQVDEEIFQEEFLRELVGGISKRILEQGSKEGDFMPDKEARNDFIFIIQEFPLNAAPEVWLDLNECVSKWVQVDEDVVRFLQDPNHVALVNDVTAHLINNEVQAYPTGGVQY